MKEHMENMSKFDENLKKEQERTKEALKQKLEERRRKRKQSEVDKSKVPTSTDGAKVDHETPQKLATTAVARTAAHAALGSGVATSPHRGAEGGMMFLYSFNSN